MCTASYTPANTQARLARIGRCERPCSRSRGSRKRGHSANRSCERQPRSICEGAPLSTRLPSIDRNSTGIESATESARRPPTPATGAPVEIQGAVRSTTNNGKITAVPLRRRSSTRRTSGHACRNPTRSGVVEKSAPLFVSAIPSPQVAASDYLHLRMPNQRIANCLFFPIDGDCGVCSLAVRGICQSNGSSGSVAGKPATHALSCSPRIGRRGAYASSWRGYCCIVRKRSSRAERPCRRASITTIQT